MRKRDSLRRWKARARLGRVIPLEAILNHRLDRMYGWEHVGMVGAEFYRVARVLDRRFVLKS